MNFRILPALLFSGSLAASGFDAAPPTPPDEKFGFTGIAAPAPPATRRLSVPDLPYEAQVAASERLVTGFSTRLTYAEERRERPYLAYVELFDAWQEEQVKQNVANATRTRWQLSAVARRCECGGRPHKHSAVCGQRALVWPMRRARTLPTTGLTPVLAYAVITALHPRSASSKQREPRTRTRKKRANGNCCP